MGRRPLGGREIVQVLVRFGFVPTSRAGSHVRLRYEHPTTGEVRLVDVPLHDEVAVGTLRSIAEQCGAEEFEAWRDWIERHS